MYIIQNISSNIAAKVSVQLLLLTLSNLLLGGLIKGGITSCLFASDSKQVC